MREKDKAGIGGDNKKDTKKRDKAGTKRDDKAGRGKQDKETDIGKQDNERAVQPAARFYYIETQRFLHHAFFLAAHFNSFLAFSSLESVIG